jgi:hypothetical protein
MESDFKILDNNGWDLEKVIPETDYECIEQNTFISLNYGEGIKMIYNNENYTTRFYKNKHIVRCEITTWRGLSPNAIHYYGNLQIGYPEFSSDLNHGCTVSGSDEPLMFKTYKIELTNVLEQWEIDKFPQHYEGWCAGSHHHGFYSQKLVKDKANEVFNKIFEKGWILKFN